MEPLATQPLRCSGPKAKVLAVLLSMVLCTVMLFLLQLKFLKPKTSSFYTFQVKDAKGRPVSLDKFKGKLPTWLATASSQTETTWRCRRCTASSDPSTSACWPFPATSSGRPSPGPAGRQQHSPGAPMGSLSPSSTRSRFWDPKQSPRSDFSLILQKRNQDGIFGNIWSTQRVML
ncbi:putative glutathione peroxidase 8 isoform 2-T2 [Rhynchonycteris naso]